MTEARSMAIAKSAKALAFLGRACMCALLLLLAIGTASSLGRPIDGLLAASNYASASAVLTSLVAGIFAAAAIAAALYTARRAQPFAPRRFVLCAVAASLAIRTLLIWKVDPTWGGDYLRYWDNAVDMAAKGAVDAGSSYYRQRALPIFLPLASLFGDVPVVVKFANAIGLTFVLAMAYDVLRLCRSHQAAQGFSLILLLAPIPAYEALIPSHNLWGVFFAVLCIWLFTRACYAKPGNTRWWAVSAYAALAALAIELLEIQRGSGLFLAVSLVLAALFYASVPFRRDAGLAQPATVLYAAALCAAIWIPVGLASSHLNLRVDHKAGLKSYNYMKLAAHGGTLGNGRSDSWARFDERFHEKRYEGPGPTLDFARSIVLTSWIDPDSSKFRFVRSLTPRLFDLGYPADWDVTLKSPSKLSKTALGGLIFYANFFGLIFSVLFVVALLRACLPGRQPPVPVLAFQLFTAMTAIVMLLIFENKAPNLFSIWIASPLLIASAFSARGSQASPLRKDEAVQGALTVLAGIGLAVAGYWLVVHAVSAYMTDGRGRIIAGWSMQHRAQAPIADSSLPVAKSAPLAFDAPYYKAGALKTWVLRNAAEDSYRLSKYAPNFYQTLELPLPLRKQDTVSLTKTLCVEDGSRPDLEFFLFSGYRPSHKRKSFFVDVSADGRRKLRIAIPTEGATMQLVRVPGLFDNASCKPVSIELVSNVDRTAASWQRASHVEIWLPRLVRAKP